MFISKTRFFTFNFICSWFALWLNHLFTIDLICYGFPFCNVFDTPCSYHRRLEFVLSFNIICVILFACLSFTTNVFLEILQTFFRHWNEACFAHKLYQISLYLTTNNNSSLFLRYRGFRIPRGANAMEGPITSDIVLIGGNSHVELANLIAR